MFINPNASNFIDRIRENINNKYKIVSKNETSFHITFDEKFLYIESDAANNKGHTERFVGLFENNLLNSNVYIDRPYSKYLDRYDTKEDGRYISCKFGPAIECNKLIDIQNGIPSSLIDYHNAGKIQFSYNSSKHLYLLLYNVYSANDDNIINSNIIFNNIIKISNDIISIIQDEYCIDKVRISYSNTDQYYKEFITLLLEGKFINDQSRKIYITIDIPRNILSSENITVYEEKIDISNLEPFDYTTPEMIENSLTYSYDYCVDNDSEDILATIPMSNLDDTGMHLVKEGYNMYCNEKWKFSIEFIYNGIADDIPCDIDNNKFARVIKIKTT